MAFGFDRACLLPPCTTVWWPLQTHMPGLTGPCFTPCNGLDCMPCRCDRFVRVVVAQAGTPLRQRTALLAPHSACCDSSRGHSCWIARSALWCGAALLLTVAASMACVMQSTQTLRVRRGGDGCAEGSAVSLTGWPGLPALKSGSRHVLCGVSIHCRVSIVSGATAALC